MRLRIGAKLHGSFTLGAARAKPSQFGRNGMPLKVIYMSHTPWARPNPLK